MTISTKYDPGTQVWLMHDNKPLNGFIDSVDTSTESNMETQAVYKIRFVPGYVDESLLFGTKEELLQSL